MTRGRIAKAAALLYLLGAAGILASFLSAGHEGTGYLPMIVWALPASLVGLAAVYWPFGVAFPFMPAALGYYGGHIAFFLPSVAIIALFIWRVVRGGRS
jgi:hypothetical protein